MRLWKQLVGTEVAALASLFVAAALMAAYGLVDATRSPGMISAAGSAQIGFFGTLLFGVLPVTLFGAPIYVWLARANLATWLSVSALGFLPSALLALVDLELAFLALLCGPTIAWLTHLACRRWVSPNNSSKPKPLRGSA
jgi:hypothetical protein